MKNPWVDLPDSEPFVLGDDRPRVHAFNRAVDARYQLRLNLLPEPFLGSRDARLVLLMLNPGFANSDLRVHKGGYGAALRANLVDDPSGHIHLGLSSGFKDDLPWWTTHLQAVIERVDDLDALARKVLAVEFHGYHAQSWKPIPVTLPSQQFGFWLVEQAIARGATIVPMRGERIWEIAIPSLHGYENLVRIKNPRAGTLSPGNCEGDGFERVLHALE